MLEGAPARYDEAGLDLYRTGDGRLWIQEGGAPANPYGKAAFSRVPWPEPMARPEAADPPGPRAAPLERAQRDDSHAGHAH